MPSCISIHVERDNTISGVDATAFDKIPDEISAATNWCGRKLETSRRNHGVAAYLERRPFR
jgi:hypothetical protein